MAQEIPYKKATYGVRVAIAFHVFISLIAVFVAIVGSGSGAEKQESLGEWVNVPDDDDSVGFVCSMPAPCPSAKWSKLGSKCFLRDSAENSLYAKGQQGPTFEAEKVCNGKDPSAHLAVIESVEEDKFAFNLCADEKFCLLGLIGGGDTKQPANWQWIDGSASPYRNWWKTDDHEEPTGDHEHTCTWMTSTLWDEIQGGGFFRFLIVVFVYAIMIGCCIGNAFCGYCGFGNCGSNRNKACVTTALSLDGAMVGFMVLLALGQMGRQEWGGSFFSLVGAGLFLAVSILGCLQCGQIEQGLDPHNVVVVGQAGGQPIGTVIGQPVAVAQVTGQPIAVQVKTAE